MSQESYWLGVGLGLAIGTCGILFYKSCSDRVIPNKDVVQVGFAVPSKLEIKLQDLDGNGQKETILEYNGTNYLFTLDEQGKPRVQAYEIKPAEIVPKQ